MSGTKGPGEMFCPSCGETIKKEAEICPSCGVPNSERSGSSASTGRTPAGDTIFCKSCGEEIQTEAAICPSCGVKNDATAGGTSSGGAAVPQAGRTAEGKSASAEPHDPSEYSTNVSDRWTLGVVASALLAVCWAALPLEAAGLSTLVFVASWATMPVSVYFDRQWLRANTTWNPNTLWILGALAFPPINTLVGIVYLIQRHGTETAPETRGGSDTGDPALAELRRRYSEGEIGDAEFEARLERLLETERGDEDELSDAVDIEQELK